MKSKRLLKITLKKSPIALVLALNSLCVTAQFNPNESLSELNGTNGFVINGVDETDRAGRSVSAAGDMNGDGFDDVIVGADGVNANGFNASGATYVVFGKDTGFNPFLELSAVNGSNGFVINGVAEGDESGFYVSKAGDINGDGVDDIIIGADSEATNGVNAGACYVVFGNDSGFNSSLELSSLNGSDGFLVNGLVMGDRLGRSVSAAGDINGDGLGDIIIGALGSDNNGDVSGSSYVVFGRLNEFNASLDLTALNGSNGFVINGIAAGDLLGTSVSTAGDFNGDGLNDIIIGAPGRNNNANSSGASYVVFGSLNEFNASLDLTALDGNNGFVINGISAFDGSGSSVNTAGDVNGDGFDDIIIGAPFVDADASENSSGASYVVFGNNSAANGSLELSSLNGNNGFVINGISNSDSLGSSVSTAGDLNGDGFDDILIGAPGVDSNNMNANGASYVVFGSGFGFNPVINVSSLNGNNGLVINGADEADFTGGSVSAAGDVNGDNLDDIIIGGFGAGTNGVQSGASHVVFGAKKEIRLNPIATQITDSDLFGFSVDISGDFAVVGAPRDDTQAADAGAAYIYQRIQGHWSQVTKLLVSEGAPADLFGWAVAIDGSLVLVAAIDEDGSATFGNSGSVYAFQRSSDGAWNFIQKIRASDAQDGDNFGSAVGIDGNKAVIGAVLGDDNGLSNTGSAYVFEFDSNSTRWDQVSKLLGVNNQAQSGFGSAVAIDGDNIAIGSYLEDGPNATTVNSGSVYMFKHVDGSGSTFTGQVRASDTTDGDFFGFSVALDGTHLAVGAKGNNFTGTNSGAAYIFEQTANDLWNEINYFTSSVANDDFGYSIDIKGNRVLVGSINANGDSGFADSGGSFLFALNGGAITQLQTFNSASSRLDDQFGYAVGISGTQMIVGAPFDDNNGANSGSVYIASIDLIFTSGFEDQ